MGVVFAGMAASLDGYIAAADGSMGWLLDAMAKGEDYGFAETAERSGAYIIGAGTYRGMLDMGMAGRTDSVPVFVVSHQADLPRGSQTTLYSGHLVELLDLVRARTSRDICVYGGGQLVSQLLELDLIDELGISVIPVLLGTGLPFFPPRQRQARLELLSCRPFPSGIVLLNYRVKHQAAATTPR